MTASRTTALALEAMALLVAAELALRTVGFVRLMRTIEPRSNRPADPAMIEAITWAVQAAANRLPFPATCLRRALAAAWMLKRRGIRSALHYGVTKGGPHGFQAHAWLSASDLPVIGEREAEGFNLLQTFPRKTDRSR